MKKVVKLVLAALLAWVWFLRFESRANKLKDPRKTSGFNRDRTIFIDTDDYLDTIAVLDPKEAR